MLYRLCQKADESIDHVVSGCSKFAQMEYKSRHDKLDEIVHWKLAGNFNFEAADKWYEHEPESENYTLLVGSLGSIPKQFCIRLKETGITAEIGQIQKTVSLGTARILRRVLKI